MKYNFVKILSLSILAINTKANIIQSRDVIASEIILDDNVTKTAPYLKPSSTILSTDSNLLTNSVTTKTIAIDNTKSNSRIKARQFDNGNFEPLDLPDDFTDFDSILVPVDSGDNSIQFEYLDSDNKSVTYEYSSSGTKAIVVEHTDSGNKAVSFDYSPSGTKTINTVTFDSKDNIKDSQTKKFLFHEDEELEEGEEYDPFKYRTSPPKLYYDKEECGNTNIYQNNEKFFCYRNNRLYDVPSSIDYLYMNMGIFYKGKSRYIHPVYDSVCSGPDADIIQCYKNVAELLKTDVFSIMPKVNNTILNVSESSENLKSSDSIIREYFCGKEYFYSFDNGKDICLRPFKGTLSDNLEAIYNKIIVNYEGEIRILVKMYSNVCYDGISSNSCYKEVADLLGENIKSIKPLNGKIEGVYYSKSLSDIKPSQDTYNWNDIEEVMDSKYCPTDLFDHGNIHICYDYYGKDNSTASLPVELNEYLNKKIVKRDSSINYVLNMFSSLDVQWLDPIKNFEYISKLNGNSGSIVSLLPITNSNAKSILTKLFNRKIDFDVNNDFYLFKDSSNVFLQSYKGNLPSSMEEVYSKQLVYYKGGYHSVNSTYSTICKSKEAIDCYMEIADILDENFVSLIPNLNKTSIQPFLYDKFENNALHSKEKTENIMTTIHEYYCGGDGKIFRYKDKSNYVCLEPYEGDLPEVINEKLLQRFVFYNRTYYTVNISYSSSFAQPYDLTDVNVQYLDAVFRFYQNLADLLEVKIKYVTPLPKRVETKKPPFEGEFEGEEEFLWHMGYFIYTFCSDKENGDRYNFAYNEYKNGDRTFTYVCLRKYYGAFTSNLSDMINKRIMKSKGEYYIADELFSNRCYLNDNFIKCYSEVIDLFPGNTAYDFFPNYNETLSEIEIFPSVPRNESSVLINNKYRCGKDYFYNLGDVYLCLTPLKDDKYDFPKDYNSIRDGLYLTYNYKYYRVRKELSSISVQREGYTDENYEAIAKILGVDKDSLIPSEVNIPNSENSELSDLAKACGEEYFFNDTSGHVCLELYDEKRLPETIEEILLEGIIYYKGKYYDSKPMLSSTLSRPYSVLRDNSVVFSDEVYNYYYNVAHIMKEQMTSIMPRLPNTNVPNFTESYMLSAAENYDAVKKILGEYYCGKDSFYSKGKSYVCLRPYRGAFSSDISDMKRKKIIYYNNEHYIVHHIFSNVCLLKSNEIKCYSDLFKLLDSTDAYSLYPKYEEQDLTEIEINLNDSYTTDEPDIERIIDQYRCNVNNFYYKNNVHVCLSNLMNGKNDIPNDRKAVLENMYIVYKGMYYKVDKEYSSIAVQRANETDSNYSLIAEILQVDKDSIIP